MLRSPAFRKLRRRARRRSTELLEPRQLLTVVVTETFRPFAFDFEGDFRGTATVQDTPQDYVVEFSGGTTGSGVIDYTSPTEGAGTLTGNAAGNWIDNAGDAGTFTGQGEATVEETNGLLTATSVSGSGSSSSGLAGSINLTGLGPGEAEAIIDLPGRSAVANWDLDISSLIGSPADTQGIATVSLSPELTDPTDLEPVAGAFTSSGGVEYTVAVTGELVPTNTRSAAVASTELFWASGPELTDILGPASSDSVPLHWNTDQVQASVSGLSSAPNGTTHLLVVVDGQQQLDEANEDNNVLALALVQAEDGAGKVTGGGTMIGGAVNFGFVVKTKTRDGITLFHGNLQFNDRENGIRLHSESIDTLTVNDDGSITFSGTARINGKTGSSFRATVFDAGEPGRGKDRFLIEIDGPSVSNYSLGDAFNTDGRIDGGNIQFHFRKDKKK